VEKQFIGKERYDNYIQFVCLHEVPMYVMQIKKSNC